MSPLVRFILLRLLLVPLTLLVVTATLMALLTVVPPEVRALQYLPYRVQYAAPELTRAWLASTWPWNARLYASRPWRSIGMLPCTIPSAIDGARAARRSICRVRTAP